MESFNQLQLMEPIQRALRELNYQKPTPIQAQSIPHLIKGCDILGCAQTGTGKTAAFALPILQRLALSQRRSKPRSARCLVLTPTRELAQQIAQSFRDYGRYLRLSMTVVYGGVGQVPQVRSCARGVDVLVATPGRLLDLMGQGHIRLDRLEIFVLDEADRMLDMGFLPDIKKVLAVLPAQRQTMFFSATMPPAIAHLADSMLVEPLKVAVTPTATPVESIDQQVLFVSQSNKRDLLAFFLKKSEVARALVFTRTKHGADRVVRQLGQIQVQAESIHGNKSQNARQAALQKFRSGRTRVLVATDIAARGIDVEGISHVINYDLPNEPECYVHRIGRTGRAGADGIALSFCDSTERASLRAIERLIHRSVPVLEDHPYKMAAPAAVRPAKKPFRPAGTHQRKRFGKSRPRPAA